MISYTFIERHSLGNLISRCNSMYSVSMKIDILQVTLFCAVIKLSLNVTEVSSLSYRNSLTTW